MAKTRTRYNYKFRPKSYWVHSDPLQAILSGISGTARRQMITDYWNAGKFDELEPGLLQDDLDDGTRWRLGAFDPFFMGGEYLPPRLPGEVAIVTIRLESVTFDVIELRARPLPGDKIGLRWVDEYDCPFETPTDTIDQPFTFRELIRFIESTDLEYQGQLPHVYNDMNYQLLVGDDEEIENLRTFTSFSSDFYPQLGRWAANEIEKWFDERIAEEAKAKEVRK